MSKRDDYRRGMEENLDLYNARLTTLKAHTLEAQPKELDKLAALASDSKALGLSLTILKVTSGDEWDGLRTSIDKAWRDIESALTTAETSKRAEDDAQRATTP